VGHCYNSTAIAFTDFVIRLLETTVVLAATPPFTEKNAKPMHIFTQQIHRML